jgi:zinc protease
MQEFSVQKRRGTLRARFGSLSTLALVSALMFMQSFATMAANAQARVSEFMLANGMHVVVIPDTRAPVVTHMVWYRVGSADEPHGTSGIAHFLEHLMFKSTEKIGIGEFSKIVARLGGNDNAFTSNDATAYFQRIAKERLPQVMEMEADRMVNLKLTEKEVLTERDVILEERRSRIENSPAAILDEQMSASLYQNHPYHIPVIGWMHEIAKLSQADALAFYKKYYAPNNAILVVAGDVTADGVKAMAEATYGKIKSNPAVGAPRVRPSEPEARAPRRVDLKDQRAGRTTISRHYIAPSYTHAAPGEAEALDLLLKIAGGGTTGRLYKKLVVTDQVASSAGGYYSGSNMDSGKIGLSAVVADGSTIEKAEAAIDAVIADMKTTLVTPQELERAKKAYIAEYIYESDNQSTLARRYGWGIVSGNTLAKIDAWPKELAKITAEQIRDAAIKHLDLKHSVTGTLQPLPVVPAAAVAAPAKKS